MSVWDSIIIGGGPAGQSAALYLARFNRKVLVLDRGGSRTLTYELNENYLGFPEGIHSRQLYELGRRQAQRFGAEFEESDVEHVTHQDALFNVVTKSQNSTTQSVIFATGVTDLYPNLPNYQEYLGKTLFWCITCDGYKTLNKKVVIIGDTDEAACTAAQFLQYTPNVTLLTNYKSTECQLSPAWRDKAAKRHISIIDGCIQQLHGHRGVVESIELENGQIIPAEIIFNLQGAVPNSSLAATLGVNVNEFGYILTDTEQRTNIPFVYAAGDVTKDFAHQIITAAHEGSMAAQACNYDLYDPDQRM